MHRVPLALIPLLIGCSEWTLRGEGTDGPEEVVEEPVANAGADITTVPLTALRLDGTGSYDPANLQIVGYRWTLLDGPDGSIAALSNPDNDRPFFEPDVAGEYLFDLSVKNSRDVWDSTPDQVVVDASPEPDLYVQLTWDGEPDLDLHMTRGDGPLFQQPDDVCWCNASADWGVVGVSADDGRLVEETSRGFGPEIAAIDEPADGSYTLSVHYYGNGGGRGCDDVPCEPTVATLRVFVGGLEVQMLTQELTNAGDVWRAATVTFPTGAVTPRVHMTSTSEFTCF